MNYIGTFALTKALLPLIQKNEGRIANVTVPSEVSPYWHPLAYVASKASQNAMTGIMAMEFQQNNIPVEIFTVHPGPTTTDLNGNMSLPVSTTSRPLARRSPSSLTTARVIRASSSSFTRLLKNRSRLRD